MKASFEKTFRRHAKKACVLIPLNAPPAAGGVLWAGEMANGEPVTAGFREKVLNALTIDKYDALVNTKP